MLFKYFTEKNTNESVAVNPQNVSCVRKYGDGTIIYFIDGRDVKVVDDFQEVAPRLSEK